MSESPETSLVQEIKKRRLLSMKAKATVAKDILGVALGELQTAAARLGVDEIPEAEGQAILKKLIKSNREALDAGPSAENRAVLEEEIGVIESLLPKVLDVDAIVLVLEAVRERIASAAGVGPAMGVAMGALKATGARVEASDVQKAVAKIRS